MIKTQLQTLIASFDNAKEMKLKAVLIEKLKAYGADKTSVILSAKNQLILNSCGIDENLFNQILFKNYIYFLNSKKEINLEKVSPSGREAIESFKTHIQNNNFDEAFNVFSKNYIIYQLLCIIYIKDIYDNGNENQSDKINKIRKKDMPDIYIKLSILKKTNLTQKKEEPKTLQRILPK